MRLLFAILLLSIYGLLQGQDKAKEQPFLGVEMSDGTKKYHELMPNKTENGAVLIQKIVAGSSAYSSDLKADDLIYQIGEFVVRKNDPVPSMAEAIKTFEVGDTVLFKVIRITTEYTLNDEVYDSFRLVEERIKALERRGVAYSFSKKITPQDLQYKIKLGSRSKSSNRKDVSVFEPQAKTSNEIASNLESAYKKINKEYLKILSDQLLVDSQMNVPGDSGLVNFAQQNPEKGYALVSEINAIMSGEWFEHLKLIELFEFKELKTKPTSPLQLNDLFKLLLDKKEYEEMYFGNNPESATTLKVLKTQYFGLNPDEILENRDIFKLLMEDEKLKLDESFVQFLLDFYIKLDKKNLDGIVALNTQNKIFKIEHESLVILIGTKGDDIYQQNADLIIDPGGNDQYLFQRDVKMPIIIDFTGNDSYVSYREGGVAAEEGLISIIKDYEGNDVYKGKEWSVGTGVNGIGIIEDFGGDDLYEVDAAGIGLGLRGLGAIIDHGGNDRYQAGYLSVGVGLYRGLGLVKDHSGNDIYKCSGYASSSYKEPQVLDSLGIGFGFGLRGICRGGVGVVGDLEGDDLYVGGNFSVGCGYYFGTGVLLDRKGNDRYKVSRYGLGSSAHSALGLFFDAQGDDQYETDVHGIAGAAWDLSCAYFIDGGGNDRYKSVNAFSFGAADQSSFALHLDLLGNDSYENEFYTNASNIYHNGKSVGVFVNYLGNDKYPEGFTDKLERETNGFYFTDK